ncbi:MAG: hypothetical protein ABSG84_14670 [Acidobacteriaceae bacterium]|jgi:hypothetical protein
MNLGPEDRKKIAAFAVFAVIASGIVYFEYFYTGAPATPATPPAATATETTEGTPARAVENTAAESTPPIAGRAAKAVGASSSTLDPTLHMEAMLVSEQVEYSGNGRNIFSPNSAPPPVVIPKAVASARNQVAAIAPPPQPTAPPPPPIDLKFFGFETRANGTREAFLLHNDDVYLASAGDVVLRRYRVITIDARTIQVEDMQNKNTQTLPLLAN